MKTEESNHYSDNTLMVSELIPGSVYEFDGEVPGERMRGTFRMIMKGIAIFEVEDREGPSFNVWDSDNIRSV